MDKMNCQNMKNSEIHFIAPFTSPSGLGAKLSLSSWAWVLVAGISLDWFFIIRKGEKERF